MADASAILLTTSLAYLFSSYLKTMMDQTSSGITENPGASDFPVVSELKAMLKQQLMLSYKSFMSG